GPLAVDAGSLALDAGSRSVNAGPPAVDAGSRAVDAGALAVDAGQRAVAAGALLVATGTQTDGAAQERGGRPAAVVPPNAGGERSADPHESKPPAGAQASVSTGDLEAIRRAISDRRGAPLLVNFWAVWCDPCVEELPDL